MISRKAAQEVSLQARLAWRLGLVLTASLSVVIVAFAVLWAAFDADDLEDLTLSDHALQIVRAIMRNGKALRLELPEEVAEQYEEVGDQLLYIVIDRDRRVLFASSKLARELATLVRIRPPEKGAIIFRLPDDLNGGAPYDALVAHVPGEPDITLIVAQRERGGDDESFIEEFGETFIWVLPPVFLLAIGISIATIRGTLAPLKTLSERSADIGPGTINIRLSTTDVAREIRPLVDSFNGALERLDQGYQAQRNFAANAAHELRTPLAVLMARLNELEDSETKNGLEEDARRLERLVSQLLTVARAESQTLDLSHVVNLRDLAADVVGFMAPLAIKRNRTISLRGDQADVPVKGNPEALWDVLRNLIENAIQHTPTDTEVEVIVIVNADASVTVRDSGPGVSPGDRESIFQPFWRGPDNREPGAGLGLAIIAETIRAHGGTTSVGDAPDGGADFTIRLPLSAT